MSGRHRTQTHTYDYPRPMVTVDLVVIAPRDDRLSLLLVRRGKPPYEGSWALPGGFVEMDESLADAARRELAEETGLNLPKSAANPSRRSSNVWMDQLRAFGQPDRDPRGRTITVAYLVLIRPGYASWVRAGDDAADARWFDPRRLPRWAFDHRQIVRTAMTRLRDDMEHAGLAFRLVPATFTLAELQRTYEMIFGRDLNRDRFRRRVRGLGVLEPTSASAKRAGRSETRFRYRPGRKRIGDVR